MGHLSDESAPLDSSGTYLFKFNGISWNRVDSVMNSEQDPHMGQAVYSWQTELYSLGPNVYFASSNGWTKVVSGRIGQMSKSSETSLIAVGSQSLYFNGARWIELLDVHPLLESSCLTTDIHLFVVTNDGYRTIVYHGK